MTVNVFAVPGKLTQFFHVAQNEDNADDCLRC